MTTDPRHNRPDDPSPEEIEQRAAQVRAGWTEQERRLRTNGFNDGRWTVPRVNIEE